MKDKVNKLNIHIPTNVVITFNNLKTKVDELTVGELKTVPIVLKKLSDVVGNKVVKIQN